MPKKYLNLFLIIVSTFLLFSFGVSAQNLSTGTALSVVVEAERPLERGDIISVRDGIYMLSDIAYDGSMFGVITDDPALVMDDLALENRSYIVFEGEAFVKVSSQNGNIAKGDFVTSSEIPGVGQKATESGQVIGVALQDFSNDDTSAVDDILVHLGMRSNFIQSDARSNLVEALRSGSQSAFLSPLTSLRYILAALITAGSFMLGFASFGKTSGSGVEALGRNPLAHKEIQRSIVLNMILTAFIMIVGLGLAYMILVL